MSEPRQRAGRAAGRWRRATGLLALLALPVAAGAAPPSAERPPGVHEPGPEERARLARYQLETARKLRREGRLELAGAAALRGLDFAPDHAGLHRERARILEALGRAGEAARERAAADAADPPPPPPPDTPLEGSFRDIVVVLVPPPADVPAARRPRGWPAGPVAEALAERLARRLPGAPVVHRDFESVASARAWLAEGAPRGVLSLRVDRVVCGDTIKDGRFGMAWLRGAAERPGTPGPGVLWGRAVVAEPRLAMGCEREMAARALERVLALGAVREALAAAGAAGAVFETASIRALFPGLTARIEHHLAEGEARLAGGRVADAAEAFRRALEVDPGDAAARTLLREAEATLALSEELSRRRGGRDRGDLDPQRTPAQRAALEARLAVERRRREELLAALAVLGERARLPDAATLAGLRPVPILAPEAFGPTLARRRAGGEVEARAATAPDGAEVARYYFAPGERLPVLREEDANADGRPDRWVAYAGDTRAELWEDSQQAGRPDLRLVFADGARLQRVEIDRDGDDRPERVLRYGGGVLRAEAADSDGDGVLDTFDTFDAGGRLRLREEDTDADGRIDRRSRYGGTATPE